MRVKARTMGFGVVALLMGGLALVAVACDGDDDDGDATATPVPSATAPAACPTPPSAGEPAQGDSDGTIALLQDVRLAAHDCFDRIVFEFESARPGFRVEFRDEVSNCASGEPETVEGEHLLFVQFQPANAHDEAGNATSPNSLDLNLDGIIEARLICDFEADVQWLIGTSTQGYELALLDDPPRIVIDVYR